MKFRLFLGGHRSKPCVVGRRVYGILMTPVYSASTGSIEPMQPRKFPFLFNVTKTPYFWLLPADLAFIHAQPAFSSQMVLDGARAKDNRYFWSCSDVDRPGRSLKAMDTYETACS